MNSKEELKALKDRVDDVDAMEKAYAEGIIDEQWFCESCYCKGIKAIQSYLKGSENRESKCDKCKDILNKAVRNE